MKLSEFGYLRVAACSPSVRVADVEFNVAAIVEAYQHLRREGVQIALFPELATREGIDGYQAARKTLKKHEARLLVR